MKRYAIWDKKTPIMTPSMEVFTPREWIAKYPAFGLDSVVAVCAAGEVNGGFAGTLGQMMQFYEGQIDFSECTTPEEKLAAIEAFEDARNTPVVDDIPSAEERIAAALEYQVMASLPDVEEEVTETTNA